MTKKAWFIGIAAVAVAVLGCGAAVGTALVLALFGAAGVDAVYANAATRATRANAIRILVFMNYSSSSDLRLGQP